MSRMLLDESRGEHNSPCVNSTTTSMTSAQKVMGGEKKLCPDKPNGTAPWCHVYS